MHDSPRSIRTELSFIGGETSSPSDNNNRENFPVRLHRMLDKAEPAGFSHIVSWQPHGRCFHIHDREKFMNEVLPVHFNTGAYSSFQRQLNLYGFTRIPSGPDRGCYYHILFLRGHVDLAFYITRHKYKGQGPRKPDSSLPIPDFWNAPSLLPSNSTKKTESMATVEGSDRYSSDRHTSSLISPMPSQDEDNAPVEIQPRPIASVSLEEEGPVQPETIPSDFSTASTNTRRTILPRQVTSGNADWTIPTHYVDSPEGAEQSPALTASSVISSIYCEFARENEH